jgi:endo-1,4-beta-xylanase
VSPLSRRRFLKDAAFAGLGAGIGRMAVLSAPSVLTAPRTVRSTAAGEIYLRPTYVQAGRGPHLLEWAYASDDQGDTFRSNVSVRADGVRISDAAGRERFGLNVRWNVEGFGYLYVTADNGGRFYALPRAGETTILNLNLELARSRVARNQRRIAAYTSTGWKPSLEVRGLLSLSEGCLDDALHADPASQRCGGLSQTALRHALWASEKLELEFAQHMIRTQVRRTPFMFGCDVRAMFEMDLDLYFERFSEVFNYGAIVYVWRNGWNIEDFEPREGDFRFGQRDLMVRELGSRGIAMQGRPLFWFHKWVTPDWVKDKSFDQLLSYVERTTKTVMGHYGDAMYGWEIVNEIHDWANECQLDPEQITTLARLACDVAKSVAPNVHRIVNNCCPFAEYVHMGEWSGQPARYPQRTPWQFTRDLSDAGVDFTILAQQIYFPYRDLQDIVISMERLSAFKKPVQLSELGASSGPSAYSVRNGALTFPREPYTWHRHWDEELQADWVEAMFSLAYSKPWIEAASWFDFVDPHFHIDNGGLLRSPMGEPKAAYNRLRRLRSTWKQYENTGAHK